MAMQIAWVLDGACVVLEPGLGLARHFAKALCGGMIALPNTLLISNHSSLIIPLLFFTVKVALISTGKKMERV